MTCKTIAVANQKGGTGKTATTLSLGIALAKLDKRVLLVDTDPQGDLTKSLGWSNPDSLEITVANHIQAVIDGIDLQAREGILSHKEGIDLMPANIDLASMEMGIFMAMSREQILNTWLSCIKDSYDYVLIDCAPTLGILPVNAFVASDSVLIPVSAEFLPASAMTELLKTINRVKRQINPSLDVEGILITLFDTRNNLAREVEQTIRNQYSDAYQALLDGRGDAFSTDNTEVLAWALENKGYEVGITSLGDPDTIAPAVQKGNKELLDFINDDIQKLGKENFFHKAYEKTLHPTYGDAAKADDLVVEGGEVK